MLNLFEIHHTSITKNPSGYEVSILNKGFVKNKYFKTLQEAENFKKEYDKKNNL